MAEIEDKQVKEYKGKKYGTMILAKDVRETMGSLEERQSEIDEKASNKSMWSNIGSIVGGIAGLALGPVGWGMTALAAGGGALAGGAIGAMGADAVKGKLGNLKRLEGSLFSKSKDSQAASVKEINKGIQKKIVSNAITTAATAGWTSGGGAAAGEKLSTLGVSDKITKSKVFTAWGGKEGTKFWGEGKAASNPNVSVSGPVDPTKVYPKGGYSTTPVATSESTKTVASNATSTDTATSWQGKDYQNMYIAEQKGLNTGKSLVDQLKSVGQDSSYVKRGADFAKLTKGEEGQSAFYKWLEESGIKV
jgi:hypothetical protein